MENKVESNMRKIKWTKELVLKEAKKYKTRSDFYKYGSGIVKAAVRLGILDEARAHMPERVSIAGENHVHFKWSFQKILEEALKYKTRTEFQEKNGSAHHAAIRSEVLDEVCSHMPEYTRLGDTNPRFRWTDEMLYGEALKYNTKPDFKNHNYGAFLAAQRRGIVNKICAHMKKLQIRWSFEELVEEAKKYKFRSEFETKNPGAYNSACNKKVLDKVCKHMKRPPNISPPEREIFERVVAIFVNAKTLRDRSVKIKGKPHIKGFHIDIFVPELKLGIEFDGTWTHSFDGLRRGRKHWPDKDLLNYHKLKDAWFATKGIKILHIKQKDWDKNKEKCIERCLKFLGVK